MFDTNTLLNNYCDDSSNKSKTNYPCVKQFAHKHVSVYI